MNGYTIKVTQSKENWAANIEAPTGDSCFMQYVVTAPSQTMLLEVIRLIIGKRK